MPKSGSCETSYEKALKLKKQEEANKPLRPITTEEEESQKETNNILMKMTAAASNLEIEEIERKQLTPKPFEIAEDNPQKKELEEHLKREEEKNIMNFCPKCGFHLQGQGNKKD